MIGRDTSELRGWGGPDGTAPPEGEGSEELEIRTEAGARLLATLREPRLAPGDEPLGTLVLAHASFARRTEWERPEGEGLAPFLVARGWRTLAFDFGGHGDSGAPARRGGRSSYDGYVRSELPAVVACARDHGGPVVVVGHSLGGHVALASQGTGRLGADAIVAAAVNVWLPSLEPSLPRLLLKRGVASAMLVLARRAGFFPARALRVGSDDETPEAVSAFLRCSGDGTWRSDDGQDDYLASLTRVTIPVAALLSEGDRLLCAPVCGERFVARTRGAKLIERVALSDDGSPPPGHMGIVTSALCRAPWARIESWLRHTLSR